MKTDESNIVCVIPIDKVLISVGYNSLFSTFNTGRVVPDLITTCVTITTNGIQPKLFNVWEFGLISSKYAYMPKAPYVMVVIITPVTNCNLGWSFPAKNGRHPEIKAKTCKCFLD